MSDDSRAVLERLIESELALLQPAVRTSAERLDTLIADDFREIASSGRIFGKEEALSRLPRESGVSFETMDMQAQHLASDVVLVTYRACRSAGGADQHSLRSSLWRCDRTGWRMVFHQGTPLAQGGTIPTGPRSRPR